jgi:hypothetical protein
MLPVHHHYHDKIAKLRRLHRQRLFATKEGGISCSASVSSARYVTMAFTSVPVANINLLQGGFARVYEVKDHRNVRYACKVVTKSSLKTKKAKTKVWLSATVHCHYLFVVSSCTPKLRSIAHLRIPILLPFTTASKTTIMCI